MRVNNYIINPFFQGLFIIASLATSTTMILRSFEEWNNNPVITTIETIEAHLTDNDLFPALTICHEPQYQPDNWALLEISLNFFVIECNQHLDPGFCDKTEPLRKDFQSALDSIFWDISYLINSNKFEDLSKFDKAFTAKNLQQALLANLTTFSELKELMRLNFGKFDDAVDFVKFFVPKTTTNNIECNQIECDEFNQKVLKLLLTADTFVVKHGMGFGTFLRQHFKSIGETFSPNNIFDYFNKDIKICNRLTSQEKLVHGIMTKIGESVGMNVSAYDIQSLYSTLELDENKNFLAIKDYPFYTMCQNSNMSGIQNPPGRFILCDWEWAETLKESNHPGDNPYVKIPYEFCSRGVANITGSKIQAIMEMMKYAYHLNSHQDVKQLFELVQSLNLPYAMRKDPFRVENKRPYFGDEFFFDNIHDGNYFQPIATNIGLCYGLNNKNVTEVFKESYYLDTFVDTLYNDVVHQPLKKAISGSSETIYLNTLNLDFSDRLDQNLKSFW